MNKFLQVLYAAIAIAIGIATAQGVAADDKDESKRSLEIRHTMTIDPKPPTEQKCEARVSLTYFQKNTVAVVESALNNSDCAASGGEYTVLVRFRDESNELQSLEYPETWHRDDDQEVKSVKEYLIGDNVDLVSVRPRKLRCVCDETATAQENSPE
jgi:hypothetical protein